MAHQLTRTQLQKLRLYNQRLLAPTTLEPTALVTALGAVQAQEKAAALLSVGARAADTTEARLLALLEQERQLVRTWTLRGTLHLLASDDLGWMLSLVAPRQLRNSRRRYRELDLDDDTLARATELIVATLAERGPQTRAQLAAMLEAQQISAEGQRMPHLLRRAALLGLLCFGPARDGEETYVLLDEWLSLQVDTPATGWATLAGRYLANYGPVSVEDFAHWSAAPKGEATAAFSAHSDSLVEADVAGRRLFLAAAQAENVFDQLAHPATCVRLLPAYDPLLLGYRSRDWLVTPAFARVIHPGGGFLRPTMVVDGEAAGTWKMARRDGWLEVIVAPFTALSEEQRYMLQAEVDDVGRFYALEAKLSWTTT